MLRKSSSMCQRSNKFIYEKRIYSQPIRLLIIWQAPRAGSLRRILCSDWLPEQARWSDTARPGLPVSFPQIKFKFRQSSRRCTKVFFRRIIFCYGRKIFLWFLCLGYISNSNFKFKFSNSKLTFVFNLPVFAAKRIFKTYQHFCFLCFHSRWRFFWFHKDREVTKSLFTLAESNFSERKLSCTRLNFVEFLFAGTKRAVPGGQYRSILPARVANQNTEFAAYCLLA